MLMLLTLGMQAAGSLKYLMPVWSQWQRPFGSPYINCALCMSPCFTVDLQQVIALLTLVRHTNTQPCMVIYERITRHTTRTQTLDGLRSPALWCTFEASLGILFKTLQHDMHTGLAKALASCQGQPRPPCSTHHVASRP